MKIVAAIIAAPLLLGTFQSVAAETIFLEENGFLTIEMESTPAIGEWQARNQISGYTGNGYYQWTGSTKTNVSTAGRDTLLYNFRITNPGNYELRWRSTIGQGNNRTEHNDSWVRFATGDNVSGEQALNGWTKAYMNKVGEWDWKTATVDHVGKSIRQYFSAGDHTMEISGRSSGHAIDRVVLYRYDDHQFNREAFDTAQASGTTTGPVSLVVPVTEPPAEPASPSTPAAEAEPNTVEENDSVQTAMPGSCEDGRAVISPVADVYNQSGRIIDTSELRVEHGNRTTYLQFDAGSMWDSADTVTLQFTVGSDNGDGVLDIYKGDHNNWNDNTSDSDSLPSASVLLGSKNSTWDSGNSYEVPLDKSLHSNNVLTLILEAQGGGSDFSVKSSESSAGTPVLIFTGSTTDFCSAFNSQQAEAQTSLQNIAEPDIQRAEAATTNEENGAGATPVSLLWLLLLHFLVRNHRHAYRLR